MLSPQVLYPGEADSRAGNGRCPVAFQSLKMFEDALSVRGRNAWPLVIHKEICRVLAGFQADDHQLLLAAVLHRVVQKVDYDLPKSVGIYVGGQAHAETSFETSLVAGHYGFKVIDSFL